MSKSIDQKIVEMQFDNKDFEKNVSTSMGTLDKLKKKLDFSDEGKSFQELEKKAEKTDFKGFKDNIDKVSVKFDAMQVAAITALTNITNKAIDTGIQLVKSLSTDQIAAGWEKFGEMTINTGTLVSQGFDIDEINEQLDKLLWFTDETSYNFTDMVNNISKFTGAGQGLTESVDAMQGIALWAAMSGQNASTASRAMYQLSQAMGSGVIKLQDWQSILTANMATQEFKQKVLDAAVRAGTLQKLEDGYYISLIEDLEQEAEEFNINQFQTQLSSGLWFTSDVLMDVLGEYSAAVQDIYDKAEETGMTASEVMEEFGDTVDQFGLKAFQAGQEARTFEDVINSIKDAVSTGYMNIFTDIFGAYDEAKVFWTDLANAAWEVFAGPVAETHEKLSAALGTDMYDTNALKEWSEMYLDSKTEVNKEVSAALADFDHYTAQLFGQKLTYQKNVFEATDEKIQSIAQNAGIAEDDVRNLFKLINSESKGLESDAVQNYIQSLAEVSPKDIEYFNKVLERSMTQVESTRTGTNVEAIINKAKELGKDSDEFENLLNEWITDDDELKDALREFISVQDSGYTSDTMVFWTLAETIGATTEQVEELYALVNEKGLDDSGVKEFIDTITNGREDLKSFTEEYVEATTTIVESTTGRQNLVEAFWALWDGIASIAERVKKAFKNVFPESQWSSVYALTVKIKDAIKNMMPSEETLDKLQNFFEGVFTVFKEIGVVLKAIFQPFGDMIKSLFAKPEGEGEGLLDKLSEWGKAVSDGFEDFANGSLVTSISNASQWIVDQLSWLLEKGKALVTSIKDSVVKFFTDPIIKTGEMEDDGTEKLISRWEWLQEKFSAFGTWASGAWESFKKLLSDIKTGLENSGIAGAFAGLWEKIKGVYEDIKATFTKKKDDIPEGADGAEGPDSTPIVSFIDSVKSFFEKIWEKLQKVWEYISPVWESIKKIFGKLWDSITEFFSWLSELDFGKIFAGGLAFGGAAGMAGGMIYQYKNIQWTIGYIEEFGRIIADGIQTFGKISEGIGEVLEYTALKQRLAAYSLLIKAIGAALLEIAIAMLIFSTIDSDKMAGCIIAMSTILSLLSGIIVYLNQSSKYMEKTSILSSYNSNIKQMAILLVAIGTATLEIAKAMKDIASIGDANLIVASGAAVALILEMMVYVTKQLDKLGTDNSISSGMGTAIELIALCLVLKRVTKVIKELAGMKPEELAQGIIGLALVLGIIGGIAFLPMDKEKAKAFGAAMLEIAIGMWIFGKYMKDIAELSWEDMLKAVVAFVAVAGALAGVMFIPFDGKKAMAFAGAMDLIAVAMLLLLPVVHAFAEMDQDQYVQALAAVAIISAIMVALSAAMGMFGSEKSLMAGGGLALAALAILELAAALAILAEIAPKLAEAGPLIANSIVEIASIIISSIPNIVKDLAEAVTEAAPSIGQMLITLIQTVLDVLVQSAENIVTSILELILKLLDLVGENIGPIIEKLINIFIGVIQGALSGVDDIVVALVELFKTIFNALSSAMGDDLDLEKILEGVAVLAALFVAMTAITLIALEALATVALLNQIADQLVIFMAKIQPFVAACKTIDPNSMEGAKTLAEVILLFTAASILEGLTSWLTGGVDYSKFSTALTTLAPAIKTFADEMNGVDGENLKNASQAALYLTEFVNNLPREGGLLQKVIGNTVDLSTFAQGLIDLAPKLVEYANEVKKLTDEDITAIGESIKAVKALADMANSLPRHGGLWQKIIGEAQSMADFAADLVTLPPALITYAEEAKKLTEEDYNAITASIPPVKALAEMAESMPRHGGLWQDIIGEAQSMTDFATDLVALAGGLINYAGEVGKLTDDDIKAINASIGIAEALVKISNLLDPTGGLVGFFEGEADFQKFATDIEWLGKGMKKYSDALKGIASNRITNSLEPAKTLVEISNALGTSGGLKSIWEGNQQSLEDFGNDLESFGKSMKKYSDTVGELNSDAIDTSNTALEGIIDILNAIRTAQGDLNTTVIKDLGKALEEFGGNLSKFIGTMNEILDSDIDGAVDDIKDLLTAIDEIPTDAILKIQGLGGNLARLAEDGVKKFLSEFDNAGEKARTSGGNFIQSFIDGANDKKTSLDTAAQTLSKAMLTQFESLAEGYEEAGNSMVLDLANGINRARVAEENLKPMAQYATGLKEKFETSIAEIDFYQVGYDILSTFCNAISESGAYVEAAFGATETGLEDGVADIKVYYTSFYDAGYYLVDGFKLGIEERSKAVEESASNLGGKAFAALKNALKEASPSKLTYQVGEFFTQGFADGIVGDIDYVERSINYISDRTYEEMQNVINNIGDKLDDDIEDNLTITPVLDLTEFEAGTRIMNRYLGDMATSRVGAMAAADSMATRVTSQSIQNQMLEKLNESETPLGGESINHNNFYIQSNDPHEVATEVSRILQKQVERRNSVWE